MNQTLEPRVAVIIPCFNDGELLREAVVSVLDGADCELVVVDDGSTDGNTLAVLDDFEARALTVIHQENKGLSAALMAGVGSTSAPYIFRLDADDKVEPGAIELLADALDVNPEASVAWGDLETFGLTNVRVPQAPTLDPWYVTYASLLPATALFRREALLGVGGWQLGKENDALSDWDLWMTLAQYGYSGVYCRRVVYRYRRDRGGLLEGSLGRYAEQYEELRRRHRPLFIRRSVNRGSSSAPAVLKGLLPIIDRVPIIPRLQKVWLAQLLAHLFWNGGPWVTWRLLSQGIAIRVRR